MRTAKELAEETRGYERNTLGSAKTYFTEVAAALDRLTACEPVIEAVREAQTANASGRWTNEEAWAHVEKVPLPAKVTT